MAILVRKTYNELVKKREDFTGFATDVRLDYFFHMFTCMFIILKNQSYCASSVYYQGPLKHQVLQATVVNGSVVGQMLPYQIVLQCILLSDF